MRFFCAGLLLAAACVQAGEIGVSPLRVELSPTMKSTVVTVTGKTGPGQFLQVSAMRWTQDAQGKDQYEETSDLVFLPKSLDLAKGKQLIRVGVEKPITDVEKTYRLFIRETPPPLDPGQKGAKVAVVVDFGLPVFLMPAKPTRAARFEDIKVEQGLLSLRVVNAGNVRLKFVSFTAGKSQFKEFRGWYLLAGNGRQYTASLPRDSCNGPLTLLLQTETIIVKRAVALTPQMCG